MFVDVLQRVCLTALQESWVVRSDHTQAKRELVNVRVHTYVVARNAPDLVYRVKRMIYVEHGDRLLLYVRR